MIFLTEDSILQLLDWEELVPVIEEALLEVSEGKDYKMPPRTFFDMPKVSGFFLSMPSYSQYQGLIACKLLTIFPQNESKYRKPVTAGVVVAFEAESGQFLATVEAQHLTEWRTAAGSIVASKHLYCSEKNSYKNKTIAVLGAGRQARIHLQGFQNYFQPGNLRIWNRTTQKAQALSDDLRNEHGINVAVFDDVNKCIQDADIILLTFAETEERYVTKSNAKPGAFICSISTSFRSYPSGIAEEVYHASKLYTESNPSAQSEMGPFLKKENLSFEEIGKGIGGIGTKEEEGKLYTIYQSLGISLMDNAVTNYLIKKHKSIPTS